MLAALAGLALLAQEPAPFVVEDTFLDLGRPDANHGRDNLLSGGAGKAILVRFSRPGTARQAVRVQGAAIRLSLASGDNPRLVSVSRMRLPWFEGPGARGIQPVGVPETGPRFSPTWNMRRAGDTGGGWDQPGARGAADAELVSGASASIEGDTVLIGGIDSAVQATLDRPYENFGFRLEFADPVEFASAETERGPQLLVRTEAVAQAKGPDLRVTALGPVGLRPDAWPADGSPVVWKATVANSGDAPASGMTVTWWVGGRVASRTVLPAAIAPGATQEISLEATWRNEHADHRALPVVAVAEPGNPDANPTDNAASTWMNAVPVSVSGAELGAAELALERVHEEVFARSRFGSAREGVLERVRFTEVPSPIGLTLQPGDLDPGRLAVRLAEALGAPPAQGWAAPPAAPMAFEGAPVPRWVSRFAGLEGWGDTRDDRQWLPLIGLPSPLWSNPMELASPLPAHGLLSRTTVVWLNQAQGKLGDARLELPLLPTAAFVRVLDVSNKPLGLIDVDVLRQGDSGWAVAQTLKTDRVGNLLLAGVPSPGRPTTPFGPVGREGAWLLLRVKGFGQTVFAWLPAWQLMDERARGGQAATMFDLRVPLTPAWLDMNTNLAFERVASDSAGSFPAQLQSLTDGDPATGATVTGSSTGPAVGGLGEPLNPAWLEVDLGRDRFVGEIALTLAAGSSLWPRFDLEGYNTGQRVEQKRLLFREVAGVENLAARAEPSADGQTVTIRYRIAPAQIRYLRIEASAGVAEVREIAAHPVMPGPPQS